MSKQSTCGGMASCASSDWCQIPLWCMLGCGTCGTDSDIDIGGSAARRLEGYCGTGRKFPLWYGALKRLAAIDMSSQFSGVGGSSGHASGESGVIGMSNGNAGAGDGLLLQRAQLDALMEPMLEAGQVDIPLFTCSKDSGVTCGTSTKVLRTPYEVECCSRSVELR